MDSLSTKDINEVRKRLELENSLKVLSRSAVASKKDKEDYLRREHMDNQELTRKVVRLTAKKSLHKAVHDASKEQREFGQKIINIGSSLGIKFIRSKIQKTPMELDDIIKTLKNPKSEADSEKGKVKDELLKVVMDKVKSKQSKP
jgi:hypothetical protein